MEKHGRVKLVLDEADDLLQGSRVPSTTHEAIIELFRNRPMLAVEMLEEALDVLLPSFTKIEVTSSELTEIVPRELRADLLVLLVDERPVLVIIVEAQLQWDPDKLFSWPAYLAGARARYRCPGCLLVVTPHAALARRLAQPIVMGPGQALVTPFVLGPAGIPKIADVAEARAKPELAALSAIAHGQTDDSVELVMSVMAAFAGLDPERAVLYADYVLDSVTASVRAEVEKRMAIPNYEYKSEFIRKNLEKGRIEGRFEGLVHLFERRLERALTSEEREYLAERLREDGVDRVGDVVLDLSRAELAAWFSTHRK